MPINSIGTPIALQVRPLDLLRAEQVKGARTENEANAQALQRQNALSSFFQQSGPALVGGDQNALNDYARIDPKGAIGLQGDIASNKKADLESKLKRLEAVSNGLDAILNVPEGPGRLATQTLLFEQQKKYLAGLGIPMDDAPDLWDEEWGRGIRELTRTNAQRLEEANKGVPANYQRTSPPGSPLAVAPIAGGPADPKQIQAEDEARAANTPPTTRNIIQGNNEVTQQWNPKTRQWENIGTPGPRFSPNQGGAGGTAGRTITERMQNTVLNGDPTAPEYAAAYAYLAKPRIVFDPNTGETIQIAPDMSWARKPGSKGAPQSGAAPSVQSVGAGGGEGVPAVTRGPGRSASPAQATFQANVQQAESDIAKAEGMLFPSGKFDRSTAMTGGINIPFAGPGLPFSQGREARQAVRRAVEIILRLRTGAAAPDSEVDNYLNLYAPSAADSKSAARTKMDRLQQFFDAEKSAASSKLPQAGGAAANPGFTTSTQGWTVTKVP